MLERIARFSFRQRGLVLFVWIALFFGILFSATIVGDRFAMVLGLKDSDSQSSLDILDKRFEELSGATGNVVFKAKAGIDDPDVRKKINGLANQIERVGQVKAVVTPYDLTGVQQRSANGQIGYIAIQFDGRTEEIEKGTTDAIKAYASDTNTSQLQVETGGETFTINNGHGTSEGLGMIAAAIILFVAFGSVVAMGLPLVTAICGVAISLGLVTLLSNLISIPEAAGRLVAMIGLGVGIDYTLLLLTRYRQELQKTSGHEEAVMRTMATAGRSVLFAGATVVISLLSMILIGIGIIQALAIAAAIVVVITMIASATLVPALLGYFGPKLKPLAVKTAKTPGIWHTWTRIIERRAWWVLSGGIVAIVILAIPAFSMRIGSSDASGRSTSDTLRRAYDLQTEAFGVGTNGPLLVAAEINGKQDMAILDKIREAAQKDSGVASVSPAMPNDDFSAAIVQITPKTSPQDEATVNLVKRVREQIIPQATKGTGVNAHVGGVTAGFMDVAQMVSKRFALFIGSVLLLSFILLLLVFRSIVIPLKAVILNVISAGAAYGVLVAVFQWGWLKDVFDVGNTGPIESFLPIMLFAILFGLSMDYEVFLLSRIKEYYNKTGNNNLAIAEGLAATARVITAAAAIMVAVFASFILSNDRVIKEFGLGLGVAVLIDATVVRLMLVPAAMELFGKRNWWMPKWLSRLPKIGI
ncbi:MAG TPA: MMPL family transporter [Candidatus Saccharimonadales bacterium]|nr:MMPL family transporter [Candidatus Saccharimonadales bacterium]